MSEEPFYTSFPGARQPPPPSASLRPGPGLRHSRSMSGVKQQKTVGCQPPAWPSPPARPTRSGSRPLREALARDSVPGGKTRVPGDTQGHGAKSAFPFPGPRSGSPSLPGTSWESSNPWGSCRPESSRAYEVGPNQKTGPDRKVPLPAVSVHPPCLPQDLRERSGWWAERRRGLIAGHTSATATGVLLTLGPFLEWTLMIEFHRAAIIWANWRISDRQALTLQRDSLPIGTRWGRGSSV